MGLAGWLRTRTGAVVGLGWLALLLAALLIIRPSVPLVVVEVAAALFGLYGSSVAFRKDRYSGYVILIALAFSFLLLNSALYMTTVWTNPLGR